MGRGHHYASRPREYHPLVSDCTQHERIRRLGGVSTSLHWIFSPTYPKLDERKRKTSMSFLRRNDQSLWSTSCTLAVNYTKL